MDWTKRFDELREEYDEELESMGKRLHSRLGDGKYDDDDEFWDAIREEVNESPLLNDTQSASLCFALSKEDMAWDEAGVEFKMGSGVNWGSLAYACLEEDLRQWLSEDGVDMSKPVERCEECGECKSQCDCCKKCGKKNSNCECCSRCDQTSDNCYCCNECDNTAENCTCCRECENTAENCTCNEDDDEEEKDKDEDEKEGDDKKEEKSESEPKEPEQAQPEWYKGCHHRRQSSDNV